MYKKIFIVTYGRSGSTLLQKILNSATEVDIKGENNNLFYNLFMLNKHISWAQSSFGSKKIGGYESSNSANPWYGIGDINLDVVTRECILSLERQIYSTSHEVVGFKEIRYFDIVDNLAEYLEFMNRYIDDSFFIFNFRNWEEVCSSGFWQNIPKDLMLRKLKKFEEVCYSFKIKNSNSCIVNYNDYIARPEILLAAIEKMNLSIELEAIEYVLGKKLKH